MFLITSGNTFKNKVIDYSHLVIDKSRDSWKTNHCLIYALKKLETLFLILHDDAWCTYERIETKMQHVVQQSIQMPLKWGMHVKDNLFKLSLHVVPPITKIAWTTHDVLSTSLVIPYMAYFTFPQLTIKG